MNKVYNSFEELMSCCCNRQLIDTDCVVFPDLLPE